MATVDKSTLEGKVLPELQEMASSLGLSGTQRMKKGDLINKIVEETNGKASEAPRPRPPRRRARARRPRNGPRSLSSVLR